MKKVFSLVILAFVCATASAQDTLNTTEVQDTFAPPQYQVVYDDVFLSKKETKWLFKTDFFSIINLLNEFAPGRQGLDVTFEHKISRRYSLQSSLFLPPTLLDNNSYKLIAFSLEPRYFFRGNDKNLNGEYVSFRYTYAHNVAGAKKSVLSEMDFALLFGKQRRVFNNFYADFKAGVQVNHRRNQNNPFVPKNDVSLGFTSDFTLGLAFGHSKKTLIETCSVFNCFEEEKTMLKLDLRGLITYWRKNGFATQPVIGFEHKLAPAWSINHELRFSTSRFRSLTQNLNFGYNLEPRFYFNLKKRIATGKSANNLTGSYFSGALGFHSRAFFNYNTSGSDYRESSTRRIYLAFIPKYGFQTKLFKRGFADISIAPLQFYRIKEYYTDILQRNNFITKTVSTSKWRNGYGVGVNLVPLFDFKIGFAL